MKHQSAVRGDQRKMLKRKIDDYQYIKIDRETTIETVRGVKIHIDTVGNIEVEGNENIAFKTKGDIDFDAENINMHAKSMVMNIDGDVYVGSSTHIIQQAPRIDLNPKVLTTGYYGNIKNNVLKFFDFINKEKTSKYKCEEVKDEG